MATPFELEIQQYLPFCRALRVKSKPAGFKIALGGSNEFQTHSSDPQDLLGPEEHEQAFIAWGWNSLLGDPHIESLVVSSPDSQHHLPWQEFQKVTVLLETAFTMTGTQPVPLIYLRKAGNLQNHELSGRWYLYVHQGKAHYFDFLQWGDLETRKGFGLPLGKSWCGKRVWYPELLSRMDESCCQLCLDRIERRTGVPIHSNAGNGYSPSG